MTHPEETRLQDYVDGLLPGDVAREVEAHLAACDACRDRVERLRELMGELRALPREIPPPRDLRPPVSPAGGGARSQRRRAPSGAPAGRPERRRGGIASRLRTAAGIALVAGTAAVVWLATEDPDRRETAMAEDVSEEDADAAAAAAPIAPYSGAARDLSATLEARRAALDPEAARLIDRNLAVVDAAIRELERARARAPDDAALARLLEARYRTKLELLRRAAALISEA